MKSIFSIFAATIAFIAFSDVGVVVGSNALRVDGLASFPHPSISPYEEEKNALRLSHSMGLTGTLRDSPYYTGRGALVEGYRTSAVTFDYSGCEVAGEIVPPTDTVVYKLAAALRYPCVTSSNNKAGNLMAVYLDGVVVQTIDLGSAAAQAHCEQDVSFNFAESLSGNHIVRAVKLTEPNYNSALDNTHNNITFISFVITALAIIKMAPLPPKTYRIEYLGDSITCGCHINCKSPHDSNAAPYTLESVSASYPFLTCSALNAQCHYIGWSSRGMYLNYYNSSATVATLFNYSLATDLDGGARSLWDFNLFTPNVVIINLGSNDFHNAYINYDDNVNKFIDKYATIMWQIASTYGPSTTRIVAVCGPMYYDYCEPVAAAIEAVYAAHPSMLKPLRFEFSKILNKDNVCSLHPDAAVSVTLAEELTQYLKKNVLN